MRSVGVHGHLPLFLCTSLVHMLESKEKVKQLGGPGAESELINITSALEEIVRELKRIADKLDAIETAIHMSAE